ncbi:LADA_0H01706g1_1 [Lachancea dasiensis]|uniref:LADA_0H01706g1_1 n=1 Tax=Lachancea dasiensis TaxID=1072105 RepID=A0A1G4JZP4_9SACH|nr:LADA_0H01706g1_1 [Lachancea dasiensis]
MAVREFKRACNYNGQQHLVNMVQDMEKDLFLVDALAPLLAVKCGEEQSRGDWRNRVLQKLGILVERDEQGNEWLSRTKTRELLMVLGIQDAFQEFFGQEQNSQPHDTDEDEDGDDDQNEHHEDEDGINRETMAENGEDERQGLKREDSEHLGNHKQQQQHPAHVAGNSLARIDEEPMVGGLDQQKDGDEGSDQGLEAPAFGAEQIPKRAMHDQQLGSPLKKLKPADNFPSTEYVATHDLHLPTPLTVQAAKKPRTDYQPDDRVKLEHLLQHVLFSEGQSVEFETALANMGMIYPHNQLDLDIPIDEHGNTPLHWLCSVANVRLSKDLIRNGADRLLGDKSGESALVKAVKSVNNYDSGTFEELLNYLYPCLILLDDMGRTVLHHIVITSGMPGCAAAAKYYLDILMGWIVKNQTRNASPESDIILSTLDLKWFISYILNARDINGDTCLNIASRLGNVSIVEALLDYGADPRISNNSGLRPVDFGAGATKLDTSQASNVRGEGPASAVGPDPSVLINNIQSLINTISQDYDMEVRQHKDQLSRLHADLNAQRKVLATSREKLVHARQLRDEHTQLTEQISNIQQAIVEEDATFKKVSGELGIDDESLEMAEFDADEPFRIDFIYDFLEKKLQSDYKGDLTEMFEKTSVDSLMTQLTNENSGHEETIPPEVLLRARISAYEKNGHNLDDSLRSVQEKQAHLEGRFRRVLSLCLKVEEDKVDGMLDGLLQAISTEDPDDFDTSEMQKFLSKHA